MVTNIIFISFMIIEFIIIVKIDKIRMMLKLLKKVEKRAVITANNELRLMLVRQGNDKNWWVDNGHYNIQLRDKHTLYMPEVDSEAHYDKLIKQYSIGHFMWNLTHKENLVFHYMGKPQGFFKMIKKEWDFLIADKFSDDIPF